MIKLDMRKSRQYIKVDNTHNIYVYNYRNSNYIAYGIEGTSKHFTITNSNNMNSKEIIKIICNNLKEELGK